MATGTGFTGGSASGAPRGWRVAGAIIEIERVPPDHLAPDDTRSGPGPGPEALMTTVPPRGVLLVGNRRRNGSLDWTPPGGVVEQGEEVLAALSREVREETGLEVTRWDGPLYTVQVQAPSLGWVLDVEVHRAVDHSGELRTGADPDGIVEAARWACPRTCAALLVDSHPWVREPVSAWLTDRWNDPRVFGYHLSFDEGGAWVVERRG